MKLPSLHSRTSAATAHTPAGNPSNRLITDIEYRAKGRTAKLSKVLMGLGVMLALMGCGGIQLPGGSNVGGGSDTGSTGPAVGAGYVPEAGAAVGTGSGWSKVYVSPNEQEILMIRFINEARTQGTVNGVDVITGNCVERTFKPGVLRALNYDGVLAYAARKHSDYMAVTLEFNHNETITTSPAFYGAGAVHRLIRAQQELTGLDRGGYAFGGENIAMSQASPERVKTSPAEDAEDIVKGVMHSPLHCANLMNANNTSVGIGQVERPEIANGYRYTFWTQVFGVR